MMSQTISPYHDVRSLPSFSLRQIDLPEMLSWQVNGKYYVVMKVELTGIRNMHDLGNKADAAKIEGDFQVLSIKPMGKKPVDVDAIERQDFENTIAQVKSGEY